MRYKSLNRDFYIQNRKNLLPKLKNNSIVLIFSSDEFPRNGDQYYPFRQNSDLYYLCGIDQEETTLMLYKDIDENNNKDYLFIKQVDNLQRIWYGEKHSIEDAKKISGIENTIWNSNFENSFHTLLETVNTIYYVDSAAIKSFDNCNSSNNRRINSLKQEFPEKEFISISHILKDMRLVKSSEEISSIKKAIDITLSAYNKILKTLKPNKYEYEIEAEITYEFIKNGAQGHAYAPIVASGKNACILHYISNDKKMISGDLLLLDFGAEYANYAADCSRTIPINGKFSKRQKECYNAVLEVFEKAKQMYIPGNTINMINDQVGIWMQEKMIQLGLFTQKDVDKQDQESPLYKRYFMHGTAHFIGIDVHDVGDKDTVLKKGMVLSCEPALYIEEDSIGIRIETDIIVDNKPIDLMSDFPLTVEEIENSMIS